MQFSSQFTERWSKDVPSAVKCLQNSMDSCLTFFDFPEEEWISLRTTNVIERLNKEFRRRTKPMEIVAGENACYTLLSFISIKMEMYWRSNPVGKMHYNLPSLRNLIEGNFTQSPDFTKKLQCVFHISDLAMSCCFRCPQTIIYNIEHR